MESEIAFVIGALKRLNGGAFPNDDVVSHPIENNRFFMFPVSHLDRRSLGTYVTPMALRVIKPRSCATTVANKKFFLHNR